MAKSNPEYPLHSGALHDEPMSLTEADTKNDGMSSPSENMRASRPASAYSDSMFTEDQLSSLTLEQKMLVGVFVPHKPKPKEDG